MEYKRKGWLFIGYLQKNTNQIKGKNYTNVKLKQIFMVGVMGQKIIIKWFPKIRLRGFLEHNHKIWSDYHNELLATKVNAIKIVAIINKKRQ